MLPYLLTNAARSLWRHKRHSLINLASLTLGLAVFSFAFIYARFEFSYNASWPEAGRIHRVVVEQRGLPGRADSVSDSLQTETYPTLVDYFAEDIDKVTAIAWGRAKPNRIAREVLLRHECCRAGICRDFQTGDRQW